METDSGTFFAPPERASTPELQHAVQLTRENAVLNSVLQIVSGLVAILNRQRQIVAVNEDLMRYLGIESIAPTLGLRPGEAIGCSHVMEGPGGCGTGKICRSCGAAIAIVTALVEEKPVERVCAANVVRNGATTDLYLKVRAQHLEIEGETFVLLFLQDFTAENRRRMMERIFFHDMSNRLQVMLAYSQTLSDDADENRLTRLFKQNVERLCGELDIQKTIAYAEQHEYPLKMRQTSIQQIMDEVRAHFLADGALNENMLEFQDFSGDQEVPLRTDVSIVVRVIANMIQNALDASEAGDRIRVNAEPLPGGVQVAVWNRQEIADIIKPRIFQGHFTTKQGLGHGLGTYSMKLLGERILGGKVDFQSSVEAGTTFRFFIPDHKLEMAE